MKRYQIGVIGAGNMGTAIVQGAVQAGMCAPEEILLYNRSAEKRAARAAMGFSVTDDYAALYASCKIVVLAVKPQNFSEVLGALRPVANARPLVVSIAAGVTFAKMETALGEDCPIIRVMPNTPLMIGKGASVLVRNKAATAAQLDTVRALFDSMGVTAVYENENMLNEVIPYNGSGPAYVYSFIDAMVKSAQSHGLTLEDATRLVCYTCIGAAEMVLQNKEQTPAELIRAVCSPGGTTIEAIHVLESREFADILAEASDKCIDRAYELGK